MFYSSTNLKKPYSFLLSIIDPMCIITCFLTIVNYWPRLLDGEKKGEDKVKQFYVSSRLSNSGNVRQVATELIKRSFVQTYDWTMNSNITSIKELEKIGVEEFNGIQAANFLVLLTPAGKSSYIEMGIALASNVRVYVHSFDKDILSLEETSSFYQLPKVKVVVGDLNQLIEYIVNDQCD